MPIPLTFDDWKRIRKALGLSQHAMARLLACSDSGYADFEREHRKAREATVVLLRMGLQDPDLIARLEKAQYSHPWPLDLVRMAGAPR